MRIHGLVVCVNYAAELRNAMPRWKAGLESLTIVTDPHDRQTALVADDYHCRLVVTDAFYDNGAHFNKGLAQQIAWPHVPKEDWLLLIDADIVPPIGWKQTILHSNPQPGWLYGSRRWDDRGALLFDDSHGYGYFQLFHASDPLAAKEPFFETDWTHAGNGDSAILLRWRNVGRLAPVLPLALHHQGVGPSHNWYGRGKLAEFDAMEAERARRGGGWPSIEGERLTTQ